MHDCVPLGTGNSRSLKSSISAGTTWEQALAMLRAGTFPIDLGKINEEGVAQKGDPLNQETLLKTAVAALYGKDGAAVPSDIFEILSKAALYENGVIKAVLGGNPVTPGDCKFYYTSYIGIGNISLPSTFSVTFPLFPEIIFTYDPTLENASEKDNLMMTIPKANTVLSVANGRFGRDTTTVEYSGNTVSWTTNVTMNWSGKTYNVIAILKT